MSASTPGEGNADRGMFWPDPLSPGREASGVDVIAGTRGHFTVLDQARAGTLTCWCAELVPAAPGRPSAADTGAAEYADRVCSAAPVLRAALVSAVDRLDAVARDRHGHRFGECASVQRAACLRVLEAAEPALFGLVMTLVYEAYYSSPSVLTALEQATGWRSANALTGSAMAPFDDKLLDRVRSLPRAYRAP